jgi:hypothetical protein
MPVMKYIHLSANDSYTVLEIFVGFIYNAAA